MLAYDSASSSSGFENTESRYTIVEPWLSVNDDFSAYHGWVAYTGGDSSTPSPSLEHGLKNSGFRTTAALGYVTQLTGVLANILDVHLPKRLNFWYDGIHVLPCAECALVVCRDFYSKSNPHGQDIFLGEKEFTHKIAKLNANMAYLCLSQKLDYNMIHIRQYLRNLNTLINTTYADIGRRGYIPIDPDFISCLEANLADDLALIDEPIVVEYDDPSTIEDEWEWETIPTSNYPELYSPDQVIVWPCVCLIIGAKQRW